MLILALSLAMLQWPEDVEPPRMITVPWAAVADPELMDRPVEVCGHVVGLYPERNEAMMAGRGQFLLVDVRGRAELAAGEAACVKGVIRRRDGENEWQRRERGLGHTVVSHWPPARTFFSTNAMIPQAATASCSLDRYGRSNWT